jgi:hypothetical protein
LGAVVLHPQNLPKVLRGTDDENNYAAVQKCAFWVTGAPYLEKRPVPSPYFVHHFQAVAQTIGILFSEQGEETKRSIVFSGLFAQRQMERIFYSKGVFRDVNSIG